MSCGSCFLVSWTRAQSCDELLELKVKSRVRRAGSWPSDWAPRRTCELCKKQFRTDNEEGFSDFMIDVCASCLRNLVKDAKNKQKEIETETVYRRRIDEISTQ